MFYLRRFEGHVLLHQVNTVNLKNRKHTNQQMHVCVYGVLVVLLSFQLFNSGTDDNSNKTVRLGQKENIIRFLVRRPFHY